MRKLTLLVVAMLVVVLTGAGRLKAEHGPGFIWDRSEAVLVAETRGMRVPPRRRFGMPVGMDGLSARGRRGTILALAYYRSFLNTRFVRSQFHRPPGKAGGL
jgi:hypothetical protein